ARQAEIVRDFKAAWKAKDINAIVALLDPDATSIADGGGVVAAALHPIEGRDQIAATFARIAGFVPDLELLERTVNGRPGLVAQRDGQTDVVISFDIVGDRIQHIWSVRNPEKLHAWMID